MKHLILMAGVSGSGKSYEAQRLVNNEYGYGVIFSADKFFENSDGEYLWDWKKLKANHEKCQAACKEAMINNHPLIIIDNTNTPKDQVPYIELARQFGYAAEVKIPAVVHPKNAYLIDFCHGRSRHGVSRDTIIKQANRLKDVRSELLFGEGEGENYTAHQVPKN